jgi:hypothetical protein
MSRPTSGKSMRGSRVYKIHIGS